MCIHKNEHLCNLYIYIYIYMYIYIPNPSAQAGCDKRSTFRRYFTGLNSELSFS